MGAAVSKHSEPQATQSAVNTGSIRLSLNVTGGEDGRGGLRDRTADAKRASCSAHRGTASEHLNKVCLQRQPGQVGAASAAGLAADAVKVEANGTDADM
jgi:hypothetical protein